MPYGLHKLTHAASTQAAWGDWGILADWCIQQGHGALYEKYRPRNDAGHKTIDGVSPTKVRKAPQDSGQLPGRKGFSAIPELPRRDLI